MRYKNNIINSDAEPNRTGVLLVNLGTPSAPTVKSVRKYLAEFLSDPRVVEIPRLVWMVILHAFVLRFRPRRSAKAYQTVWTDRGSPLMFHTQDQRDTLSKVIEQKYGQRILVDFAMRYGAPSIESKLQLLIDQGVTKLLVLPLYPQYASATTGATYDVIASDFSARRRLPHLRFMSGYHDHPAYIKCLSDSIKTHWEKFGKAEKLIMSYHGLPKYTHEKGDPYYSQCRQTTALLVEALGLTEDEYLMTFQSRLGKAEWIKPYTEQSLKSLANQGTRFVQLVCPGFPSDCLETIEEIGIENRDYFLEAGGSQYEYIPALNSEEDHISMLQALVEENIGGWV